MPDIKLIALDLDGTVFDSNGNITARCLSAIKDAAARGVHVVISTGRPLVGVPMERLGGTGIDYAITANGAAGYDLRDSHCLFEETMETELILPILNKLIEYDIHIDAFIDGKGYGTKRGFNNQDRLAVPPSLKKYIIDTRTHLEDLPGFIRENHLGVQKVTINFYPDENGVYTDRDKAVSLLKSNPKVYAVSGGFSNIEFSRAGVDKGAGLYKLCEILGVDKDQTMAIGDSENDLAIIEAAGVGVAMGNATDDVKVRSDYVTASNDEDGVALAIEQFIFKERM